MSIMGTDMPRAWTPGDDITTHPLWGEQVELERAMMKAGGDKVRNRVIKAEAKGKTGQLRPVRKLATEWIKPVSDQLKQWIKDCERSKGGPKPMALPYLKEIDPYIASYHACRVVLNYIGQGRCILQSVATEIGRTLEHEEKVRLWESKAPDTFYALQRDQEFKGSTDSHLAIVNINRFNHLLKEAKTDPKSPFAENGVSWDSWGTYAHRFIGVTMVDCILKATGWFEYGSERNADAKANRAPLLELRFKDGLLQWLREQIDFEEANSPSHWPTVVPPKRWQGTRDGGYYTPYARPPRLIRFKASQDHQKERAADEYESLDLGATSVAITTLQETPWRINQPVLEAANALWYGEQLAFKSMPSQKEEALPPRTPRMVAHDEMRKEYRARKQECPEPDTKTLEEIEDWKREASVIYTNNSQIVGRTRSTDATLDLANDFAGRDHFYFPHMLDWRGRMYPIPSHLNPQGDDLPRGLLSFGTTVPVTAGNGGDDWLAIHVANVWGQDKLPMRARIEWTRAQRPMLEAIAAEPLEAREWVKEADKPFQALAATLEWAQFLQHGDGFMSSLPVMVDGTCNGLQHLSALSRDEDIGQLVNLVPGEEQQDIYKVIAMLLADAMELDLDTNAREHVEWWLDIFGGPVPRSFTKRQVMVLPYGGTQSAYFEYVRDWLMENRREVFRTFSKDLIGERVKYMVARLWGVVNGRLGRAMDVMKWLKACAGEAAELDQPIYWVTPSGMVVRHFYGQTQNRTLQSKLDGTRVELTFQERTNKLSKKEQLQGISPNFIHSLDAACLHLTVQECSEAGIQSFASVHDAYGTHAGNMNFLSGSLRRQFVHVHEHDMLGAFRERVIDVLESVYVEQRGVDPIEARSLASDVLDKKAGRIMAGNLEIREVINSPYFFA